MRFGITCAVAVVLAATGCGSKKPKSGVRMSLAAVNASPGAAALAGEPNAVLSGALAVPSTSTAAVATLTPAGSIASGPPDTMKIYVREISFDGDDGSEQVFRSSDDRGTPVTLTNETIDLADALGVSTLSATVGSYRGVTLTVSRVAEIRGCVSGTFYPTSAVVSQPLSAAMLESAPLHAGNLYSNDPITDGQPHTFCTQAARGEVSVYTYSTEPIGSNAEFQASSTPETTEIDLDRGNPAGLSPDQLRAAGATVSTRFPFEVIEAQETKLLLAVDLNRMLRYFANTREDLQPPNPAMKAGTSYFFTTIFPDSAMLAPADGSSIEGYQLTIVVNPGAEQFVLAEWMTVIRGADGQPLGGVIIPDDDNTLTVAKGSIDRGASVETSPGLWKMVFTLGDAGAGGSISGSLDDFAFTDVGSSGTCGLTTFPTATVPSGTTFEVSYARIL